MLDLTPLVEPLSIDEAFLDLSGTAAPARPRPGEDAGEACQARRAEIGITVSIGLSHNKFLAKIASDLDKPRGFSVLGAGEAAAFLAPRPVTLICGVGKAHGREPGRATASAPSPTCSAPSEATLMRTLGSEGGACRGSPAASTDAPSIPSARRRASRRRRRSLRTSPSCARSPGFCGSFARRSPPGSRPSALAGATVTLKLKTADFRLRTRALSLGQPDPARGQDLRRRARASGARDRRHQIPPDRHRRERARLRRGSRSRRSRRCQRPPQRRRRARGRCAARKVRPRRRDPRHRAGG